MKVRIVGFTFEVLHNKGALSMGGFAQFVASSTPELKGTGESKRLLFINADHDPNYFVGLIVTVKDHKAYCELVSDAVGGMRLKVSEVAEGSHLMDFNFFVLHKKTSNGLYQHYHQSCSPTAFTNVCAQRFRAYREDLIEKELAKLTAEKRTKSAQAKVRSKFTGLLNGAVIVRQDALEELIQTMRKVKAFQYTTATPVVEEEAFKPHAALWIKKKTNRFTFAAGAPVRGIATAISDTVKGLAVKNGRVEGVDQNNIEQVLKVIDNPDTFGEYEYDSIASKINDLDLKQFQNSWVISELLVKAKENAHILDVELKQ